MGMTEQEAIIYHIEECKHRINVIKNYVKTNKDANAKKCERNTFVLNNVIKALEEISLHKQGGLVLIPSDIFENQCERLDELEPLQQPLEVDEILLANGHTGYQCKNCGNELAVNEFNGNFCNWCGQKLKWGNEDAE